MVSNNFFSALRASFWSKNKGGGGGPGPPGSIPWIRHCIRHCKDLLKELNMTSLEDRRLAGPVVQKLDSTMHWINHYPLSRAISFPNTYPLGNDLSRG